MAFTSVYNPRIFAPIGLSNEYGEVSKARYGDTGTRCCMTPSKREIFHFVPSKAGRVGTANSIPPLEGFGKLNSIFVSHIGHVTHETLQ